MSLSFLLLIALLIVAAVIAVVFRDGS